MKNDFFKNAGSLGVWVLLCFITGAIGAIASVDANEFYASLSQPSWAPPASVFGPVWSMLFLLMAVSAWLIWLRGGIKAHIRAFKVFIAQLVLNALWSWVFFAWHQGGWALLNVVLLWALIVATMISFYRIRPLAAYLLVPYLVWISFATILNYSLWQLNPQML